MYNYTKSAEYWKSRKLDLDSAPRGIWAVYNPNLSVEEQHINIVEAARKLYGEQLVIVINASTSKKTMDKMLKKFPNAKVMFNPLIKKDKYFLTKRKNLKPPIKWL